MALKRLGRRGAAIGGGAIGAALGFGVAKQRERKKVRRARLEGLVSGFDIGAGRIALPSKVAAKKHSIKKKGKR